MSDSKIISLQQWRFKKVEIDMENRNGDEDDAYYSKNQTLEDLYERQKQFSNKIEYGNDYDRGVWNGIEIAKQIINEFK